MKSAIAFQIASLLAAALLAPLDLRAADATNDPIARIRDEGLNHSQVMTTLSYLTDVIGPRLTGSPSLKRANDWTRDKLASWGLSNAHLEAWGPFGRGWELERFSAQLIEPQDIPLKAFPNAWSPGFDKGLEARVVLIDTTNMSGVSNYAGKLKGAIVLPVPPREVQPHFEALAKRLEDKELLELADAPMPERSRFFGGGGPPAGFRRGGTNGPPRRGPSWARSLPFFIKEGVAMVAIPATLGDTGVFVVQSAYAPPNTNETFGPNAGPSRMGVYSLTAPRIPAQMTVAIEDYDRMARMIRQGQDLRMAVDLKVRFYTDDPMAYNTVAEIPGSDLKDQIVMVGGHMDSWHAGTGATDNGAGVAAAMEAVRIIRTLNLQPRRTIRVALWSGEEEGLYGSKAYVSDHFGYYTNVAESELAVRTAKGMAPADDPPSRSRRTLIKRDEFEKLSVYFNLDNGAGKIRGVYMQGNEAARPLFRKWLAPFRDLEAATLTPSNTGSTDHVSFDSIGLPGFQFLQDPMDYGPLTHHTNQDVYDRVAPEDLKQAATILAAFTYDAAMMDERFPRKPTDGP